MPAFIQQNLLLILYIAGAIVGFLGSFIALVADKKPISVLAVLAVVGFIVGISHQLYSHNQQKEKERAATATAQIEAAAQRARDNVIEQINFEVHKTGVTVDAIADKLLNANVEDFGTRVVTVQSSGSVDFQESEAFAKGAPYMWPQFADWLQSLTDSDIAPSLSFRIRAGHHYDAGLLLAYLLTGPETRQDLAPIVDSFEWHDFAAPELFLRNFVQATQHLQMVLVYTGQSDIPVAFAPAREFAQELMIYHSLGQHGRVNDMLNATGDGAFDVLLAAFPSLNTNVFDTTQASELVRQMIDRELGVAISAETGKTYLVRLEKMIQLAANR